MLCEYGCKKEAKYQFKNGKWCCEKHWSRCSAKIDNIIMKHKGSKRTDTARNKMSKIQKEIGEKTKQKRNEYLKYKYSLIGKEPCKYCGGKSKYFFITTEAYCCEKTYQKCPIKRKDQSKRTFAQEILEENKLCSFGCGNIAKYKFKNGKYCCSKRLQSCPNIIQQNAITNSIKQSSTNNGMFGKKHSVESKRKNRLSQIKNLEKRFGQISPSYNPLGCRIIDDFGKVMNYNFIHAENGGEFFIEELGYWVDGYDKEKNIVLEIDERHHFDVYGNLLEKDINRQREIIDFLNCKFIRIKFKTGKVYYEE